MGRGKNKSVREKIGELHGRAVVFSVKVLRMGRVRARLYRECGKIIFEK